VNKITTTVKGDTGYAFINFTDYQDKSWADPLASDAAHKCGQFMYSVKMLSGADLPTIMKYELMEVPNQIRLRVVTSNDAHIGDYEVVVKTMSPNYPNSVVSKNISISIKGCVVIDFLPVATLQSIDYLFDSPVTSVQIPDMVQTPACGYKVTYRLIMFMDVSGESQDLAVT
jgi:hypothetical protein